MNKFPDNFNPSALRNSNADFLQQAAEIRSQVTKRMDTLKGESVVCVDKFGDAVVNHVKQELEMSNFKVNLKDEPDTTKQLHTYMYVSF